VCYADTSESLSALIEVGETTTTTAADSAAGGVDDDDGGGGGDDHDGAGGGGDASTPPAGGDGMSGSQRELVDIMQQVKKKHLTVGEAEECFYDWKMRHEHGFSRSFKQKQVRNLQRSPSPCFAVPCLFSSLS